MEKITKLHYQITAINTRIKQGKVKNVFAAKNKIKSLQMKVAELQRENNWNTFLAR